MSRDSDDELRKLQYAASRAPSLDALVAFVPDGEQPDKDIKELSARTGFSRWYPVAGGHRVLILYQGGVYDPTKFKLETGAWDHEHCKRCAKSIEPMTLCWTSESGPFVLLCDDCHSAIIGTGAA